MQARVWGLVSPETYPNYLLFVPPGHPFSSTSHGNGQRGWSYTRQRGLRSHSEDRSLESGGALGGDLGGCSWKPDSAGDVGQDHSQSGPVRDFLGQEVPQPVHLNIGPLRIGGDPMRHTFLRAEIGHLL